VRKSEKNQRLPMKTKEISLLRML